MNNPRLPTVTDLPRRWSEADAARVLAALERSGLSDVEFARRTGIQAQRLRRWRRPASEVRLVEMIARVPAPPVEATVQVVSPTGWRIEVPASRLAELVRALGGVSC